MFHVKSEMDGRTRKKEFKMPVCKKKGIKKLPVWTPLYENVFSGSIYREANIFLKIISKQIIK